MNQRTNVIVFSRLNYENDNLLYADAMVQLKLLLKQGYTCVLSDPSGTGNIVAIEYANAQENLGEARPIWVYDDEEAYLKVYQDKIQLEMAKDIQKELEELDDLFAVPNPKDPKNNA